jgi:hypothetical protein
MHRFVLSAALTVVLAGCAAVTPPDSADQPDWVRERVAAGDGRDAPAVVPVTSLSPSEERELDWAAADLLRERDQLDAEAERRLRPEDQSATEDFISDGQARTTPPDEGGGS